MLLKYCLSTKILVNKDIVYFIHKCEDPYSEYGKILHFLFAFSFYRRRTRCGTDSEGLADEVVLLSTASDKEGSTANYTKWTMDMSDDGFLHLATKPINDTSLPEVT